MPGADLLRHSWPAWRTGEALGLLAQKSGLLPIAAAPPSPPEGVRAIMASDDERGREATRQWIESIASGLDLEVEEVHAPYPEAGTLVIECAPALLCLPPVDANAEGWMTRHGALAVFLFALIPMLLYDLIGIVAGATRYNLPKFVAATFAGRFLRCLVEALLGFSLLSLIPIPWLG